MLQCSMVRRSRWLAAVLLALAAVSAARAAEPEILQQIPGDAYAVVVVGSARTFANKISNAATRLQMALPPDLLGSMTRSVGITAGFDANGSVALVLLKPGADRAGAAYFTGLPPAVLMLPTTNATLLLEKFNPTAPDKDGISEVTLLDNPADKGFVAVVDKKWIAVAQSKEDLGLYLARGSSFAKTASPETLKVFDGNDLVIWGNMEKLGAGADKWLEGQRIDLGAMRDLTNFVNNEDALQSTLQKHGMGMVFDATREFFKDAGASMVTVRLTDSGATLGVIAEFKGDSPMGKFVAAQAAEGKGVSLKGLPAGGYLVAGAGTWNGPSMAGVVGDFLNQIAADPALAGDQRLPELRRSFDAARQLVQLTGGMSFTMFEPAAPAKDGYFNGAFLIETADAKKYLDLALQNANGILAQPAVTPDITAAVTVTPGALTVKDVPLAKVNMKLSLRAETPDKPLAATSRQEFETAQRMYGPNGLTMYMGVVGQRVLAVCGTDLAKIEAAIAAAQADSDALGNMPEIAATKDQLVANPVAVAYLPIARWVTLAQSIAAPAAGGDRGGAAGAAVIANAPPVVMSVGVSGRMVTAEIHVPIATIRATQDAITRMQLAAPGGLVPSLP